MVKTFAGEAKYLRKGRRPLESMFPRDAGRRDPTEYRLANSRLRARAPLNQHEVPVDLDGDECAASQFQALSDDPGNLQPFLQIDVVQAELS